jgi:hypothetical protein
MQAPRMASSGGRGDADVVHCTIGRLYDRKCWRAPMLPTAAGNLGDAVVGENHFGLS